MSRQSVMTLDVAVPAQLSITAIRRHSWTSFDGSPRAHSQNTMESESLNFDPAMFDMKSDHGALLPAGDETKSSGSSRGRGRGRGGAQARGRGGRAGFPTGSNTVPAGHVDDVRAAQRGQGNNGSRGRGRGAYKGDGDRPQKVYRLLLYRKDGVNLSMGLAFF